jgi:predicted phage-related endonuclease
MAGSSDEGRVDRRLFIGGSDARIIMSADEAALIRLWREKRGETEPTICQATWSSNWVSSLKR